MLVESILFSCLSYHLDREANFHEQNTCFGVETQNYVALVYKNSNADTSLLLGYDYKPWSIGRVSFGATVGLVTGYQKAPVLPAVLPGLTLDYQPLSINAAVIPWPSPAVTLNLQWSF